MVTGSTGLLIIRAYLETGSSSPLRAEIRFTSNVAAGIERTLNVVDADAVGEVVRSWLNNILNGQAPDPDGQAPGPDGHAHVT